MGELVEKKDPNTGGIPIWAEEKCPEINPASPAEEHLVLNTDIGDTIVEHTQSDSTRDHDVKAASALIKGVNCILILVCIIAGCYFLMSISGALGSERETTNTDNTVVLYKQTQPDIKAPSSGITLEKAPLHSSLLIAEPEEVTYLNSFADLPDNTYLWYEPTADADYVLPPVFAELDWPEDMKNVAYAFYADYLGMESELVEFTTERAIDAEVKGCRSFSFAVYGDVIFTEFVNESDYTCAIVFEESTKPGAR